MGSGGVAIAALPTVICLKVPFSDGLGGGKDCLQKSSGKQFVSVRSTDTFFLYLFNKLRATHARLCFVCPFRMPFCVEKPKNFLINI